MTAATSFPGLLAASLAVLIHLLGLAGTDLAAATYRVAEVRSAGPVIWDSGWYGGNGPLGYSVAFPLIGAFLGLVATGAVAAFVATVAFEHLASSLRRDHRPQRRIGVWYFAASTAIPVAIGQLPFLTGEALALVALVALTRRRTVIAALTGVGSVLCSPLAATFLLLACLAWLSQGGVARRHLLNTAATVMIALAFVGVAFGGGGSFPFRWSGLSISLALCASFWTRLVPAGATLRRAAALYAIGSFVSFVFPNPLGGNAIRLGQDIGVPLLVVVAATAGRRPGAGERIGRRPSGRNVVHGAVLAGFVVWQWAPVLSVADSARVGSGVASVSFYRPLLAQITARSVGPVRIEAVPTRDHWESVFLAPTLSLARGWERQLDIAVNPIFYGRGSLDAASYTSWLHGDGVTWVALAHTDLDYAAVAERKLLVGGRLGALHLVWSSSAWSLWKVIGGPGLLSGPALLRSIGPDQVSLEILRASVITLRVRSPRSWTVTSGEQGERAAPVCLGRGPGGWIKIVARGGGPLVLSASLSPGGSPVCPNGNS